MSTNIWSISNGVIDTVNNTEVDACDSFYDIEWFAYTSIPKMFAKVYLIFVSFLGHTLMGKWYETTHAFSLTLSQPCIDDERMIILFRSSFNIKYLAFTSCLLVHSLLSHPTSLSILSHLKYQNIGYYL